MAEDLTIGRLFRVAGQRVVVTGGASGLGLGIARALAANGAMVAIVDRDGMAVDRVVAEIGSGAVGATGDVTDRRGLTKAAATVINRLGGVDTLFVNAGIGGGPGFGMPGSPAQVPLGTIDGMPDEDWDSVLRVNLDGARNTLRAVVPAMKAGGTGGRIIFTSSCAALINVPFVSTAYHVTKAAVSHLSRQLAVELAPFSIRVNSIAPANFITNIGDGAMHSEEVQRMFAGSSLMGRVAAMDEIAGLALFLASDASSYVTGIEIPIDGGARLKMSS